MLNGQKFFAHLIQSPEIYLNHVSQLDSAIQLNKILNSDTSVFKSRVLLWQFIVDQESKRDTRKGIFAEFGVAGGASLRFFSRALPHETFHGFDSFHGLRNPWSKVGRTFGAMNYGGQPPLLPKNVNLHVGWVEDTLPPFLKEDLTFSFIHLDMDVYYPTAFVLNLIKPHLQAGSLILFDDYFNFLGWQNHSHKAKIENLNLRSYLLIGLSLDGAALFKKI